MFFKFGISPQNFEEMLSVLNDNIRLKPEYANTYYLMARLYQHNGNTFEAIDYYKKAIGLDSSNILYKGEFASYLSMNGFYGEAEIEYKRLLNIDQKNELALKSITDIYKALDRYEDLHSSLKLYLCAYPENSQYIFSKMDVYRKYNKIDDVISMLEDLAINFPAVYQINETLADIHIQIGQPNKAIEEYRKAIQIEDNNFLLHYKIADVLVRIGRLKEAREEYGEAYVLNPKDPDVSTKLDAIQKILASHGSPGDDDVNGILKVKPIFKARNRPMADNYCFVLMPFNEQLQDIYNNHIRPMATKLDLICYRADDINHNEAIMEKIWEQILSSTLIIAELTGRNSNVFYELGLAHTVGKEVILLSQKREDIPFDIQHINVIIYDTSPKGLQELDDRLYKTTNAILKKIR